MRAVAVVAIVISLICAASAHAQTTLVGRGGKAAVITNGETQEIDTRSLVVNRASPFAPRAAAPKAEPQDVAQPGKEQPAPANEPAAKPGEKDGAKDGDAKDGQKAEAKPGDDAKAKKQTPEEMKKAVAELTKKQDVARLRELQQQGAWFYSDSNVPLSEAEVEQRLQAGNVADVKTLNIHLQEWKTESAPE